MTDPLRHEVLYEMCVRAFVCVGGGAGEWVDGWGV